MKSSNTESTYTAEFVQYEEIRRTFWNKQANCKPTPKYYHRYLQSIYRNYVPKNSAILEVGCFRGDLLAALEPSVGYGVDFSEHAINTARERHPDLNFIIADAHDFNLDQQTFDYIIVSELVNDIWDVQTLLRQLLPYCTSQTRLVFNFYSRVWDVPLRIARSIGFATPVLSQNWLTKYDMENLLQITGYETLQQSEEVISPVSIPVLANVSNRYLAKLWPLKHLCLANFLVARPVLAPPSDPSTVSVIVAARNEAGHIDELLSRIPRMGKETEIIFVEGNSDR